MKRILFSALILSIFISGGKLIASAEAVAPVAQSITYNYCVGGNGVAQLGGGWSHPEATYTWSDYSKQQKAIISLPLPAFASADQFLHLTIIGEAIKPLEGEEMVLDLSVNGQYLIASSFSDGQKEQHAIIPGSVAFSVLGKMELEFANRNKYNGAIPGKGIALQSINIQPFVIEADEFLQLLIDDKAPERGWRNYLKMISLTDDTYRIKSADCAAKAANCANPEFHIQAAVIYECDRQLAEKIRTNPTIMGNIQRHTNEEGKEKAPKEQ